MAVVEGAVNEPPSRTASFRGTGFTLLWLNAVSYQLIGAADRFTFVWLVDETLGAAAWAGGLVVFMLGAPVVLFVMIAGAMADRGDRRKQLLVSQVAGMVVTAITAVLVATEVMNVAYAAVTAFAFGCAFAFAQPVRMSLAPILVGRERLQRAVVTMTIGSNLATIVGPVLVGGVITRWGIAWALAMQAVLFAVGFGFAWPLRVPPRDPSLPPPPSITRRRLVREVREGMSSVWSDTRLRWLFFVLIVGGAVMTGSSYLLLPKLVADVFGRGAADAAALFAYMGIGMVGTSLLILRKLRLRRRGRVFLTAAVGAAIIQIAQGLAPTYAALAVTLFAWGVTGGFFINLNMVLIQEITPTDRLGRVVSLQQLCTFGMAPIGALVAGFLATAIGTRQTLVTYGTIGLILISYACVRAKDLRAQA